MGRGECVIPGWRVCGELSVRTFESVDNGRKREWLSTDLRMVLINRRGSARRALCRCGSPAPPAFRRGRPGCRRLTPWRARPPDGAGSVGQQRPVLGAVLLASASPRRFSHAEERAEARRGSDAGSGRGVHRVRAQRACPGLLGLSHARPVRARARLTRGFRARAAGRQCRHARRRVGCRAACRTGRGPGGRRREHRARHAARWC